MRSRVSKIVRAVCRAIPALACVAAHTAAPASADPRDSALGRYYTGLQAQLVGEGRLRQDRGGHALSADRLANSFMQVAMRTEYRMSSGGAVRSGQAQPLRRWVDPVRIAVRFGASVTPTQQTADMVTIRDVAARLGRASGHPVQVTNGSANFHVLVLSDAERAGIGPVLQQLVPGISSSALSAVRRMNRETYCMVIALPAADPARGYVRAVAIVRAEHPDRMRRSCIEEELAQGMGLSNDSDRAWPSIFNDDEEFGVLTRHDELLLRTLYDRRLAPGMGPDQVMAVLPTICASLLGQTG
ncbi:DUF2927 domain-containing protein [Rhodobacterales bacterium HKCCE3408]|nr:DUF2927 domain-containing protein [Rhodobacterales bacterium HKCCE3408]